MEFTGEIDIDQIVDEVVGSRDFTTAVADAVDEQIDDKLSSLDIDDIGDFERRAQDIATDVLDERLDDIERATGVNDNAGLTDRVTDLERRVETLTEALRSSARLVETLLAFNGVGVGV